MTDRVLAAVGAWSLFVLVYAPVVWLAFAELAR